MTSAVPDTPAGDLLSLLDRGFVVAIAHVRAPTIAAVAMCTAEAPASR